MIFDGSLIDEGQSITYNPVTNTTNNFTYWTYDYSNRTYNVTLDNGTTQTITYGDEYVTIQEGDTVYNIYYTLPSSDPGPDTPTPTPTPGPDDPGIDEPGDSSGIIAWLKKIYRAILGLETEVDVEVNISDDPEENNENWWQRFIGKFDWIRDVYTIGETLYSAISADAASAYDFDAGGGGPPSLTVDLSAASSPYGYDYGGEISVLDLSWYAKYKPTVDNLVSGFLWLGFLLYVFHRAPDILGGAGMTPYRIEDISEGSKRKRR